MRIVVVAVTILSNIAMLCNLCNAASFECKKTNMAVEQMVCSNPELSKLDDEMAMVYSAVIARATAPKSKSSGRTKYSSGLTITTTPEQLHDQQRDWLSTRNKCTDLACVTSAYVNQLNILKATIRIPKYDRSGPKSDDQKIIGIDCNKKNKTLEVGYYTAYNLPDNAMDLWDTFSLKTNSNPDNNGNQHVLAVHDVVRECSLGNTHYIVTISAVPGIQVAGVLQARAAGSNSGVLLSLGTTSQYLMSHLRVVIRKISWQRLKLAKKKLNRP